MGEEFVVLVTETSFDGKYFVGHNKFYHQILVPLDKSLLGKMVRVKIYETGKYFLKGHVLSLIQEEPLLWQQEPSLQQQDSSQKWKSNVS